MERFSITAHLKSPLISTGPLTLDALLMSVLGTGDVRQLLHCEDDLYFASACIQYENSLVHRAAFVASMRVQWVQDISIDGGECHHLIHGDAGQEALTAELGFNY